LAYPPFLLVVDVGHAIEIRADFSLTGRSYLPFPDPLTYRIRLEQLRDEKTRERLKLIWTKPLELDPAIRIWECTLTKRPDHCVKRVARILA
jgi:hypothetical protein